MMILLKPSKEFGKVLGKKMTTLWQKRSEVGRCQHGDKAGCDVFPTPKNSCKKKVTAEKMSFYDVLSTVITTLDDVRHLASLVPFQPPIDVHRLALWAARFGRRPECHGPRCAS